MCRGTGRIGTGFWQGPGAGLCYATSFESGCRMVGFDSVIVNASIWIA
jgi:hypothetical protein